jgi:hypothetical protein
MKENISLKLSKFTCCCNFMHRSGQNILTAKSEGERLEGFIG